MALQLAPIIISLLAGAANSAMKNKSAEGGEMGYDLPMLSNAPWDANNQQLSGQMAQNSAMNTMQGKLAPGLQILLNQIQRQQLQQSKEQMYGRPGQRGGSIMDNTMAMGSMGGVGPKAMMAKGSRAMNDYAGRNSQILNYIDSLKFSGLQDQQKTSFNQMQAMPRSNEIPYNGPIMPMNTPARPGMDMGLDKIDYQELMKDWYQPKTTPDWEQNSRVIPMENFSGGKTNSGMQLMGGYDPNAAYRQYPAAF